MYRSALSQPVNLPLPTFCQFLKSIEGKRATRYSCVPGAVDGGCLLLVIACSGVNQGGVGGPGTPPSGWAWSEDHFYV